MEFNVLINQVKAVEWGLSFQQAALFSYLQNVPAWANSSVFCGEVFYRITLEKILVDMPLLTDKKDTIYRMVRKLEQLGLVHLNVVDKCYYFRISSVGILWNKTEVDDNFEAESAQSSEKNPRKLGKKSEKARKKIRESSEKNPSNSSLYTNNHNTNNHTSSSKQKPTKFCDDDLKLADWFYQTLLAVDNKFKKPGLSAWADDIRLMRECDKRSHRDMAEVWQYVRGDPFWQSNVMSPKSLRKQFDRLRAKMRSVPNGNDQRKSSFVPRESLIDRSIRNAEEVHAIAEACEVGEQILGEDDANIRA